MLDIRGLEKEKTVCFTLHRIQKLPWRSNESDERLMIALFNGIPGGTKSTIDYAREKGLMIVIIKP